jgi:hypothetical protein
VIVGDPLVVTARATLDLATAVWVVGPVGVLITTGSFTVRAAMEDETVPAKLPTLTLTLTMAATSAATVV